MKPIQEDDDRVVKDGTVVRRPLMLMDHLPGAAILSDAERQRRGAMIDRHKTRLTSEWKNPPSVVLPDEQRSAPIVPNDPTMSACDRAITAYNRRIEDSWRTP